MTKSRLIALPLCTIAVAFAIYFGVSLIRNSDRIAGHTVPPKDGPSALVRSLRPNYPYSVIAGGAYSGTELSYAQSNDAVVRAHYSTFNVQQAKLVQLTDDRFQYASYRVKNQVYWTKKKLRIPKGDLLWSDGTSYARARCGNRLSEKPQEPTAKTDPPEAELSLPPVGPNMLAKLDLAEPLPSSAVGDVTPVPTGVIVPAVPPVNTISAPVGGVWGQGPVSFPPITGTPGIPIVPTTPVTPTTPATPVTPTTPPPTYTPPPPSVPVPPPPPPAVAPVPEPGSALYVFFFALAASLFALWKFTPKDEDDQAENKIE